MKDTLVSSAVTGPLQSIGLSAIIQALPMGALVGAGGYITQGVLGAGVQAPGLMKMNAEAEDMKKVQEEIKNRSLGLDGGCLAYNGSFEKSIFFPKDSDAQELVFGLSVANQQKEIRLTLPKSSQEFVSAR